VRDLALFNIAIDINLRGSVRDVLKKQRCGDVSFSRMMAAISCLIWLRL